MRAQSMPTDIGVSARRSAGQRRSDEVTTVVQVYTHAPRSTQRTQNFPPPTNAYIHLVWLSACRRLRMI